MKFVDNGNSAKSFNRLFEGALGLFFLVLLFIVALYFGLGYVIWHFISKFW